MEKYQANNIVKYKNQDIKFVYILYQLSKKKNKDAALMSQWMQVLNTTVNPI